jgi:protein-disulfide isomerase
MMRFGADPFAFNNKQFDARAHGPSRGPADSPITVIEFSDLECPACKAAQPTIDRLVSDVPNVHFIFQNFPLERIHPWAFKAAEYGDCVARDTPDAFWKFIELDYQNQESVTPDNADAKLKEFAAQAGANADRVAACVAQPATAARIRESLALGEAVQVNATPTLFVNGRPLQSVGGVPYEVLKQLVQGTER